MMMVSKVNLLLEYFNLPVQNRGKVEILMGKAQVKEVMVIKYHSL